MSADTTAFTALVLAGQRADGDPLARHCGVDLKCMAPVGGIPMLQRVVTALNCNKDIGRIFVSLPEPAALDDLAALEPLQQSGRLQVVQSARSPSASVAEFCKTHWQRGEPLLVTTADHVLLNDEILQLFLDQARRSGGDIAAGLTPSAPLKAAYPVSKRTYLRFRDEDYSGANLFALLTPRAQSAVAFWQNVEQDRKKPWRIARRVGMKALIAYLARRLTLDEAMAALSKAAEAEARAVILPIAEAAIDVDKPEDLALVETILAERAAHPAGRDN